MNATHCTTRPAPSKDAHADFGFGKATAIPAEDLIASGKFKALPPRKTRKRKTAETEVAA